MCKKKEELMVYPEAVLSLDIKRVDVGLKKN